MTSLPDWLVERAALDEVPATSRGRVEAADPRELAERIAALRAANVAELAAHPAGPAVAQIEARAAATRRATQRRLIGLAGLATSMAAAAVLLLVVKGHGDVPRAQSDDEITRVKGSPRLLAFRQAGDQIEKLEPDAIVRPGDLIQLRYNAGGHGHGVIASVDGAGVVTLHYPVSEDAPTKVAAQTTTLPNAFALDNAPHFERFFFITSNEPIDVAHTLAQLRTFASRADSATASLELPAGLQQWSLRLRKP